MKILGKKLDADISDKAFSFIPLPPIKGNMRMFFESGLGFVNNLICANLRASFSGTSSVFGTSGSSGL